MEIPKQFIEHYKHIMGDELDKFLNFCKRNLRKSIRVNTLKISRDKLVRRLTEKGWRLQEIPWFNLGFFVEADTPDLGSSLEHALGYFYIQESVSMIPPIVLDPKPGETILDMAASPGSKTTEIGMMMENKGVIVANDVRKDRIPPLVTNIQRSGVMNAIITLMDGRTFKKYKERFDRVLLDAPCSATGNIRKNWLALTNWNIKGVRKLSRLQKELILSAFDTLKPGGILVYSTCTLEPEENEGVITHLIRNRENVAIEPINISNIKVRHGLLKFKDLTFEKDVQKTIRIYPQDNDTGGFYIAKVRKI
ncbi:MAG: NOL1/NOP2/sun family putative RNA methylase [Candidatus Odinarchaeia archaeon]